MKSNWDDSAAQLWQDDLDEATFGTQTIGRHENLVLHGGGNSSLKSAVDDITGERVDVIYVKGSGWDMGSIERPGFAPLRLDRVRQLLEIEEISDSVLVNELKCASLDAGAPAASIEAPLHAMLPHRAVLHSHADAIVALTDQPDAEARVRAVFGDDVVVVPYVKPGFVLAKAVARAWADQATDATRGMVLLRHGLFTFGDSMRDAYLSHIDLITRAEDALGWAPVAHDGLRGLADGDDRLALAQLRADVSAAAGRAMVAVSSRGRKSDAFLSEQSRAEAVLRGTATPDHVIRTKPSPLLGRDVQRYVAEYTAYYERNAGRHDGLQMLDPAPRYVLDPELGVVAFGATAKEAAAVHDIALHTMDVVTASEQSSSYRPVDEDDLFDVEYWELEQAKLRRAGKPADLAGRIAIVTGAASGIGRACAEHLLAQGAAVVGIDRSPDVRETFSSAAYRGVQCDVTDEAQIRSAVDAAVEAFGGIDIVVVAAGIFPESAPITSLSGDAWERTLAVNASSVRGLFAAVHPYLALSPVGGSVVLVASKNVAAPGPGAAAYSASKAAVTQLARVAALEWAGDGIRVNIVHPDAVFDTALWTPELLAERAAKYGVTIEEYKRRNLLRTEVSSATVAAVVGTLCGAAYAATTGAQIPVDGGNERVI